MGTRVKKELAECKKCSGYPCRKEANKGLIPILRQGLSETIARKYCKVYREREVKRIIPPRYEGEYIVDSDNRIAVEAMKRLGVDLNGVYLYGEVGVGKSFLAAKVVQELSEQGKSVIFEKTADLLDRFYAAIRGEGSEYWLLQRLYEVDVLVLDDFGTERNTQYVGATLGKIIDGRYNRNKLTLITSNLKPQKACERLDTPIDGEKGLNGTRILDRLREMCIAIRLKGESRRTEPNPQRP